MIDDRNKYTFWPANSIKKDLDNSQLPFIVHDLTSWREGTPYVKRLTPSTTYFVHCALIDNWTSSPTTHDCKCQGNIFLQWPTIRLPTLWQTTFYLHTMEAIRTSCAAKQPRICISMLVLRIVALRLKFQTHTCIRFSVTHFNLTK